MILFICLFIMGCRSEVDLEIGGTNSTSWLVGKWMSQDPAGIFIEEWREDDDRMVGQGWMVNGNDTMEMEKLSIVQDSAGLTYVVNFPNREVRFVKKSQTETESFKNLDYNESASITFVNDTNDFPRQIVYRKQNDDSLYITLTSSTVGKPVEMIFKMKKM